MLRVAVLASGEGSLLRAILEGQDDHYGVVGVISDRPEVKALAVAESSGLPAVVHDFKSFASRDGFSAAVAATVSGWGSDLVASAGFGRILSGPFLDLGLPYVNSHPALLPSFPGHKGVKDALEYGVKVTGTTFILADASTDGGPVIAQEVVRVEDDDTQDTLHARIKAVEQAMYPDILRAFAQGRVTVEGRRVRIR